MFTLILTGLIVNTRPMLTEVIPWLLRSGVILFLLVQKLYIYLLDGLIFTLILLVLHLVEFAIFIQDCCLQNVMRVLKELINVIAIHTHCPNSDIPTIQHWFTYDLWHLLWGSRVHFCSIFAWFQLPHWLVLWILLHFDSVIVKPYIDHRFIYIFACQIEFLVTSNSW